MKCDKLSRLWARTIAFILVGVLLLVRRSWRIRFDGLEQFRGRIINNEHLLIVFWHGKYLPLLALLNYCRVTIFTTRSFRGEIISTICRLLGSRCIQLVEHAGIAAMTDALDTVSCDHPLVAMAVDGPRGPYHHVHLGSLRIARQYFMKLTPVSFAASRVIILGKRWDRMEIPLPFCRLGVVLGDAITIAPEMTQTAEQILLKRIGQGLDDAEKRAKTIVSIMEQAP